MTSNNHVASDQEPFLDASIGGVVDQPEKRQKSQKRIRNHRASASYDDAEYEQFLNNVARSGLSISGYIRMRTLGDPGPRTQTQPHPAAQQLGQVLAALGKIGSNFSQLARLDDTLPGLKDGITAVSDMRAYLHDILAKRSLVDPEGLADVYALLDEAGNVINTQAYLANSKDVQVVSQRVLKNAIDLVIQQMDLLITVTHEGDPLGNGEP